VQSRIQSRIGGGERTVTTLRVFRLVNLALLCLLAFLAYRMFEPYWNPPAEKLQEAEKKAGGATAPEKREITRERYNVIEHSNIFKDRNPQPTRPPEPTAAPTPPPPLPPIDLELKGTTTSPRDGNVKAIIYNKKTRKTDYYRENDIIPDSGGVKILKIDRNRLQLDRGGQSESLELYPVDLNPMKEGTATKSVPGNP
jgi:hypothetical protein